MKEAYALIATARDRMTSQTHAQHCTEFDDLVGALRAQGYDARSLWLKGARAGITGQDWREVREGIVAMLGAYLQGLAVQAELQAHEENMQHLEALHTVALYIDEGYNMARPASITCTACADRNKRPDGLPYFHAIAHNGVTVGNVYHAWLMRAFKLEIHRKHIGYFDTLQDAMKEATRLLS